MTRAEAEPFVGQKKGIVFHNGVRRAKQIIVKVDDEMLVTRTTFIPHLREMILLKRIKELI